MSETSQTPSSVPDGDLVATAVEPGAIFRVDARTGARKMLAG